VARSVSRAGQALAGASKRPMFAGSKNSGAVFNPVIRLTNWSPQRLCPGQPTVHHGPIADHGAVEAGQRAGGRDCAVAIALGAVAPVGALPHRDRGLEVELEIGDAGEPVEHLPRHRHLVGQRLCRCERFASTSRVAGAERGAAFPDQLRHARGHVTILSPWMVTRRSISTRISTSDGCGQSARFLEFAP
jgi:hypothetical protein